MTQLEEKCQNMEIAIIRFTIKFDVLRQKGLPNPLVINDRLMKQEDYDKKIREFSKEQVNKSGQQRRKANQGHNYQPNSWVKSIKYLVRLKQSALPQ